MTPSNPPSRWPTRILAAFLLLFCVGAGFAAGFVVDRLYLVTHGRVLPRGGAEFVTRHLTHRLDRSLNLTDQQEAQVGQIFDRHRERILGDCSNMHVRFHRELDEANREISALLTPEQRERFEKMHRNWRRKR